MNRLTKQVSVMLVILLLACPTWAGSNNSGESIHSIEDIASLAKQVERHAAEKGAHVIIVSRLGSPRESLPQDVQYTHTGIAIYSMIQTEDGRTLPGYTVYNLYQNNDDPSKSSLVADFPVNFFAGVQELRTGLIIPAPELQRRLLALFSSGQYKSLHNSHYSIMSNPFNNKYQNCNEFILDVINAAIYQQTDTAAIKSIHEQYFTPYQLKMDRLRLFLGAMFRPDVKTDDHKGAIETVTYTSIRDYLRKYGLIDEEITISLTPSSRPVEEKGAVDDVWM